MTSGRWWCQDTARWHGPDTPRTPPRHRTLHDDVGHHMMTSEHPTDTDWAHDDVRTPWQWSPPTMNNHYDPQKLGGEWGWWRHDFSNFYWWPSWIRGRVRLTRPCHGFDASWGLRKFFLWVFQLENASLLFFVLPKGFFQNSWQAPLPILYGGSPARVQGHKPLAHLHWQFLILTGEYSSCKFLITECIKFTWLSTVSWDHEQIGGS